LTLHLAWAFSVAAKGSSMAATIVHGKHHTNLKLRDCISLDIIGSLNLTVVLGGWTIDIDRLYSFAEVSQVFWQLVEDKKMLPIFCYHFRLVRIPTVYTSFTM
jgi:hypothetical protein